MCIISNFTCESRYKKNKDIEYFYSTFSMIRIRGFTLIELLVVVAVVGVLAGATIVLIDPQRKNEARE